MPGGESWAAAFIRDAGAEYLWAGSEETGSLSLGLEEVLEKAPEARVWVAPSQFTSYSEMQAANPLYTRIRAFREQRVYTYAKSLGPTGGMRYFELGPSRPDLILKDLIYYIHPGLLPDYTPVFFQPLDP
jgi:iron complex transport system substrate-binding protein